SPVGEGKGGDRPLFVVSSKGDVTQKAAEGDVEAQERRRRTREKLRQQLKEGKLEEREVEIEVQQQGFPMLEMMQPPQGMEGPDFNFTEWLQEMMPKKKKRRTVHLHEARRILADEELKKLVDMDDVVNEALDRVENHGVIFIDELDKIAGARGTVGPDVSREGPHRGQSQRAHGKHRRPPAPHRHDQPARRRAVRSTRPRGEAHQVRRDPGTGAPGEDRRGRGPAALYPLEPPACLSILPQVELAAVPCHFDRLTGSP